MGRYSAAYADPRGAGDARPTAIQVIKDEGLENKLEGKTIVITGATSGIGLETARALFNTGANLILTGRDLEKARPALKDLLGSGRVALLQLDLSLLKSVREAAAKILAISQNQVNILICNAGLGGFEKIQYTSNGHEMMFGVNYLSHFALFQYLKPAMLGSASADFSSRVVLVSSSAHRARDLPASGDYAFQKTLYNSATAYSNSKLAMVYMANEIDRHYGDRGLHATSLHPGFIETDISRNMDPEVVRAIKNNPAITKMLASPEQGAATSVIAAVGKEWEGRGGRYLEDCEEAKRGKDDGEGFGAGYVRQTYDEVQEARLWKDTMSMLEMNDES